jgi:hypothetical protein
MNRPSLITNVVVVFASMCAPARPEQTTLTDRLHHLRADGPREWNDFPETPEASLLRLEFNAKPNATTATLRLRQQDVKQQWQVLLNENELGRLHVDENDMLVYFEVPAGTLVEGKNSLLVQQRGERVDDIRVGEIILDDRARRTCLSEASVRIAVVDQDSKQATPCRITVLNEAGALQSSGTDSSNHLAVRPGTIYTSTGVAELDLPSGKYRIVAGRGFEYSMDEVEIEIGGGQQMDVRLSIRREVPTEGYVTCDTHVHTRTHSGHGDATVQERMITLAGEGIELPIATDHNVHIDHDPFASDLNVRRHFTPVIGNEVTTRTGHFNIFPVVAGSKVPDYKSPDWKTTLDNIFATPGTKVAILNHARDVHGGTTPFSPQHFNDAVGENLDEWHMGFNAMEVINSGATQTDAMQLFRDWMALLNRGRVVTPVGSSDSHDVARHFVGQGRTYIRCDDRDPGNIDVEQAVNNFLQGRVMVSYGLLTEMKVNESYGPGELARVVGDEVTVDLRVLGPHWTKADKIMLFANGQLLRQQPVADHVGDGRRRTGVLWSDRWTIPRPHHDVYLVAIATGPGIEELFWRTAKPYQPDTPDPTTMTIGCSGAIWLDVDGDGKPTSAFDYAKFVLEDTLPDNWSMLHSLKGYDAAVAMQLAHLLQFTGSPVSALTDRMLKDASPATRQGFTQYANAWRRNVRARAER